MKLNDILQWLGYRRTVYVDFNRRDVDGGVLLFHDANEGERVFLTDDGKRRVPAILTFRRKWNSYVGLPE